MFQKCMVLEVGTEIMICALSKRSLAETPEMGGSEEIRKQTCSCSVYSVESVTCVLC